MKRASCVLLSLALLGQACAPTAQVDPSASFDQPTPAVSASPTASPAPTASEPGSATASPAAGISASWERIGQLEPDATVTAGLWSESRWIVTGGVAIRDEATCGARTWLSDDGRSWTRATPDESCDYVGRIAHWSDGYVAVARTCNSGSANTAHVRQSVDAQHWTPLGSIDLGRGSNEDECEFKIEDLAVADAGIVFTARRGNTVEVFRSPDGIDWARIPAGTFGVPPKPADAPRGFWAGLLGTDMAQVPGSGVLLAAGCVGCPVRAWESDDGSAWTELGRIDIHAAALEVSMAVGPRVVVAFERGGGLTAVWTLGNDGSFRETMAPLVMGDPHLVHEADGYLLVGMDVDGGLLAFVSPDGVEWTMSPAPLEGCALRELIEGPSSVLVSTYSFRYSDDCDGLWLVDVTGP